MVHLKYLADVIALAQEVADKFGGLGCPLGVLAYDTVLILGGLHLESDEPTVAEAVGKLNAVLQQVSGPLRERAHQSVRNLFREDSG